MASRGPPISECLRLLAEEHINNLTSLSLREMCKAYGADAWALGKFYKMHAYLCLIISRLEETSDMASLRTMSTAMHLHRDIGPRRVILATSSFRELLQMILVGFMLAIRMSKTKTTFKSQPRQCLTPQTTNFPSATRIFLRC